MTLEYREIRGLNIKSFFHRRCPRRRRCIFLNSPWYANNALWYTAFADDTMVYTSSNQRLWECVRRRNFQNTDTLNYLSVDFQPLSMTIAKVKNFSSTTRVLQKIFSDKVHAILIEEVPVQTTLRDPVQTPNFSLAELNSNLDRPKLTKVRLLIQTSNLIRRTQFSLNQNWSKLLVKKPKTETACKIRYNNLCIRFGTWKVRRLNQSRSKGEIPGWARREERLSRSKCK